MPSCLFTGEHVAAELRRFRATEGGLRPVLEKLYSFRELLDGAPPTGTDAETLYNLCQAAIEAIDGTPRSRMGAVGQAGAVAIQQRWRPSLMRGEIKNWNETRGFGFVAPEEGEEDVFVHARDLPDGVISLAAGQMVEFVPATSPDGRPRGRVVSVDALASRVSPTTQRSPAAGRSPSTGRERIWTPERRTELADKAANALMDIGVGDAPDVTDATTRVDAMRLLLEAVHDDTRER